jgi:hypothetical protein
MVTIICEIAIGLALSGHSTHRHKVVIPKRDIKEIRAGSVYTLVLKNGRKAHFPLDRCIILDDRFKWR